MLPDLSLSTLATLAAACLAAGLVRGFTGFGAGLVFVPFAASLIGPRAAVAMLWSMDIVLQPPFAARSARRADVAAVAPLAVGAVLGIPAGVALLARADPLMVRWLVAGLVLAGLALVAMGRRRVAAAATPESLGIGAVSGLMQGLAGLGGLAPALFWLAGTKADAAIRAALIVYVTFLVAMSGINLGLAGLISVESFRLAAIGVPFCALGMAIGASLFARTGGRGFRPLAHGLIGVGAVVSLPLFDGIFGR